MNTFLVAPIHETWTDPDCLAFLDDKRLFNQFNECTAIGAALHGAKAWSHHPATKMWWHHHEAFYAYMYAVAAQMRVRGRESAASRALAAARPSTPSTWPGWMSSPAFFEAHRRNLVRKDPQWYTFTNTEPDDVYIWPILEGTAWILRRKQTGHPKYTTPLKETPEKHLVLSS